MRISSDTMLSQVVRVVLLPLCVAGVAVPGAMQSIGEMMGRSPVQVAPDTSSSDGAGEIIKGLAKIPAPGRIFKSRVDPVVAGEDSCDRDRSEICPESWIHMGALNGGSTKYCHAGSQYFGPCSDEPHAFDGMSANAKKRWSRECQAYFPCKSCQRNYQQLCPETWTRQGTQQKCKANAGDYDGPCRGEVNFDGHNADMLEAWSEMCGAYWKCRGE